MIALSSTLRIGHPAIAVVAGHFTVGVERRGDMGENPIMVTVARHVLDEGENLAAILDGVPQQAKHATRACPDAG